MIQLAHPDEVNSRTQFPAMALLGAASHGDQRLAKVPLSLFLGSGPPINLTQQPRRVSMSNQIEHVAVVVSSAWL